MRSWRTKLVIAVIVSVLIPLSVAIPGAYGDGGDSYSPPEKADLEYPNLSPMLNQLVERVETGDTGDLEAFVVSDPSSPVHLGSSLAVTVYLSDYADDVAKFLEEYGASPRNIGEDYIEAYVPVALLGEASELPGVNKVRVVVPPRPLSTKPAVSGQGIQAHGSTVWNFAGYSGQGIKVGIIDVGFTALRSLMGAELPLTVQVRCYTEIGAFTEDIYDCDGEGLHGTAVAESVFDIAPEATLYIANPWSKGDLSRTVDWMISEGVSVINHSVGWTFDGPGDGSSPYSSSPLVTADRAAEAGVLWVNAAGNSAEETWFGPYSDVDGDGLVEFDGTDELNTMILPGGGCNIHTQLRWEDAWGGATRDLDLYVVDTQTGETVASSGDVQAGNPGDVPYESVIVSSIDGWSKYRYALAVVHRSGDAPDWLQLTVWSGGTIEHHTMRGSITNPAESAHPGVLSVGAAPWFDTSVVEDFSSRGPVPISMPNGRVEPDLVAVDCGETSVVPIEEEGRGFCGTSQAAPHVAGMAVLVRQRFPELTPEGVAEYLRNHAEGRGPITPNNTWGYGLARLPAQDADPPLGEADRDALVSLYDTLGGDEWDEYEHWLSGAHVNVWYGVGTDAEGRVLSLDLYDNGLTGEIPDELESLTELEYLDLSSNRVSGEIPGFVADMEKLHTLDLSGNHIDGELPEELGNFANLEVLSLGHNALSGTIPANIGDLEKLQLLNMAGNFLTGEIPEELGSLGSLGWLDLAHNEITGEIPPELGSLTNLILLSLRDNGLSGEIPPELANLQNLQVLRLSGNDLTGCVPNRLLEVPQHDIDQLDIGPCEDIDPDQIPEGCGYALPGDGTAANTVVDAWAEGCDSAEEGRGFARYYTFTLGQESELSIVLESEHADTYLYLREGESRLYNYLAEDDDSPDTTRSEIQGILGAGTYTIEATTYRPGETGSFTLTLISTGTDEEPVPTPTLMPVPTPAPTAAPGEGCVSAMVPSGIVFGEWAPGCESTNRDGRHARYYTFTVRTPETITITLESSEADTYLNLLEGSDEHGEIIHFNDDVGSDTTISRIEEHLEVGTYTIEATTYEAGEKGGFTLTVRGL